MSDLILHHYSGSPFSEKVRLILGYKRLSWRSVLIPMIMPKPDVIALTGGYRRTPILQVGADIYCDTALIADVLERLQPTPTLYPPETGGAARILAQWADSTLFWTVIPYVMQPAGLQALFGNASPDQVQAFINDRKTFRGTLPRMPLGDATGALRLYLDRLESMLTGRSAFLLGGAPTIADFSVYHCLWFVRRAAAVATILDQHPQLQRWIEGMQAIGNGHSEELSSGEAVAIAQRSAPAAVAGRPVHDFHQIPLGGRVVVAASDYGMDPVEGILVVADTNELAVRRTDPRAGEVVVHFPRIGFQMKRAE